VKQMFIFKYLPNLINHKREVILVNSVLLLDNIQLLFLIV
jgi:hypothetical protein